MPPRKHEMCNTTQIPFFSLIFSDRSSYKFIVNGVSIGIGVLISVVVGLVILWALIRRNSRKENTKGDYGMRWIIEKKITVQCSSKIFKESIKRVLNKSSNSCVCFFQSFMFNSNAKAVKYVDQGHCLFALLFP